MKRLLLFLTLVCISLVSFAQEDDPAQKHNVSTNSFWCNWFAQADLNWSVFYSNEEHGTNLATSPLKSFRAAPNFSVALGKWFTPGLGLRTKFYGVSGRQVFQTETKNSYRYWDIQEQALFNLSNLFRGYNPTRLWNLSLLAGAGIDRNSDTHTSSMAYSLGLMNQMHITDRLSLNIELGWLLKEHDADGAISNINGQDNRLWEGHDNQLYAELGLTFDIGKVGWDKTPDVESIEALSQAQLDALNAQLNDANEENARLREMLSKQKLDIEE